MNQLQETQKAWLAAALDGEGTIGFNYYSKACPSVRIEMGNTNLEFMQYAQIITGIGKIKQEVAYYADKNRKFPMFRWNIYGLRDSADLLEQILPYLIIKREKARRVLTFCKFRLMRGKRKFGVAEHLIVNGEMSEVDKLCDSVFKTQSESQGRVI